MEEHYPNACIFWSITAVCAAVCVCVHLIVEYKKHRIKSALEELELRFTQERELAKLNKPAKVNPDKN